MPAALLAALILLLAAVPVAEGKARLDTAFAKTGFERVRVGTGDFSAATAMAVDAGDGILLAGAAGSRPVVLRLHPSGRRDRRFGVVRLDAPGAGSLAYSFPREIAVARDGTFTVLALAGEEGWSADVVVWRLDRRGRPVTGWGTNGVSITRTELNPTEDAHLALTPDGGAVIAGSAYRDSGYFTQVVRLDARGTPVAGFGGGGVLTTLAAGSSLVVFDAGVTPGGVLVLTGSRSAPAGPGAAIVGRLSLETGALLAPPIVARNVDLRTAHVARSGAATMLVRRPPRSGVLRVSAAGRRAPGFERVRRRPRSRLDPDFRAPFIADGRGGSFVAARGFVVQRLTASGSLDRRFGSPKAPAAVRRAYDCLEPAGMDLDRRGRIVVAGLLQEDCDSRGDVGLTTMAVARFRRR